MPRLPTSAVNCFPVAPAADPVRIWTGTVAERNPAYTASLDQLAVRIKLVGECSKHRPLRLEFLLPKNRAPCAKTSDTAAIERDPARSAAFGSRFPLRRETPPYACLIELPSSFQANNCLEPDVTYSERLRFTVDHRIIGKKIRVPPSP
jgi:hypothetical protein